MILLFNATHSDYLYYFISRGYLDFLKVRFSCFGDFWKSVGGGGGGGGGETSRGRYSSRDFVARFCDFVT